MGGCCALLANAGIRANSVQDVVLVGTGGPIGDVANHVGVGHLRRNQGVRFMSSQESESGGNKTFMVT